MNIEKVNSIQGCGKCIFCLSKCPKCGTAKVKVQYIKNHDESGAFVACECGQSNIETFEIPPEISTMEDEWGNPTNNIRQYDQTYYHVPELTKLLDDETKDYQPCFIYLMTNNTEDELTFELDDDDDELESESELPDDITYKIVDKTDKHCMVESTHNFVEVILDSRRDEKGR